MGRAQKHSLWGEQTDEKPLDCTVDLANSASVNHLDLEDAQAVLIILSDSYNCKYISQIDSVFVRYNEFKSKPVLDPTQNIDTDSVLNSVEDGITHVSFSRDMNTGDSDDDFIFDGTNCAYFLFAWGGRVFLDGLILDAHQNKFYSDGLICLRNCDVTGEIVCVCRGS